MPLKLIVHGPICPRRKRLKCDCEPQVYGLEEREAAIRAREGDITRMELGEYTPPVHCTTLTVPGSQSSRHRPISD